MKITPEIIQHNQFHKGVWFLPLERPFWYYFMRKKNENRIRSRSFLRSVDEPIRDLVRFLHSKGFRTTPSCSGHFRSEKEYEKIFNSLEKDERDIKGYGLKLNEIESGKTLVYKEKDYSLPFNRSDFVKNVNHIQQNGVLGIRFGNNQRIKKRVLQLKIEGVKIVDGDDIVCIHTSENNSISNERTWKKITSEIKYIFQWIEFRQPHGAVPAKKAREQSPPQAER